MIEWLLQNSLIALIISLLLVGVGRWAKFSPAMWHALWVVVLIKLASPIGLLWQFELPRLGQSTPIVEPVFEQSALEPLPMQTYESIVIFEHLPTPPVPMVWEPEAREIVTRSVVPAETPPDPLKLVWVVLFAGAVVYLLRQCALTLQFHRIARSAKKAPEKLAAQVASLARELGLRCPTVGVLKNLSSPVVWTFRRPVLLWPEGLERSLDESARETVLIHELAHLRRRDHWVRWLEMACGLFHWWNPLFWFVRRQIRYHSELACDGWVMASKPEHRRTYAEALLEVCSRTQRVSRAAPVLGIGGDGKRDFERRLTMIMQNDSPCELSTRSKLGLLALATAFLPGWALAEDKIKEDKQASELELILELAGGDEFVFAAVDGVDAEKAKKIAEMEKQLATLMKQLAELKGGGKVTPPATKVPAVAKDFLIKKLDFDTKKGAPEVKVFDKSGVELKDIKISVVGDSNAAPHVIALDKSGKPLEDVKVFILHAADGSKTITAKALHTDDKAMTIKVDGMKLQQLDKAALEKLKHLELLAQEHRKTADTIAVTGQKIAALNEKDAAEIERKRQAIVQEYKVVVDNRVKETTEGTKVVALSRGTYKLPKDKAEAIQSLFKEKGKDTVLEMKYEGDTLTVTTTPEVQAVIGNVINLMTGKPIATRSTTATWSTGQAYPAMPTMPPIFAVPAVAPAPAVPKTPSVPKIAVPVAAPKSPEEK